MINSGPSERYKSTNWSLDGPIGRSQNHIHSLKRTVKWIALKDMELLTALAPNLVLNLVSLTVLFSRRRYNVERVSKR